MSTIIKVKRVITDNLHPEMLSQEIIDDEKELDNAITEFGLTHKIVSVQIIPGHYSYWHACKRAYAMVTYQETICDPEPIPCECGHSEFNHFKLSKKKNKEK